MVRMLDPDTLGASYKKTDDGYTPRPTKEIRMLDLGEPATPTFDLAKKGKVDISLDNLLPDDTIETLRENPNIYATIGALYETGMSIGNFALDIIPGMKYTRPDDRAEYLSLDRQHQVRAGLYEALGASIFTPGAGQWLRLAGKGIFGTGKLMFKGVQAVSQRVKPRLKIQPIEDLAKWTTGNYEASLKTYLRKRHFTKEETTAIFNWFDGDVDALRQGLIRNRLHGKAPSKAMQKILVKKYEGEGLKTLANRQGRDFWLDYEFIRKVDPAKLRMAELHRSFTKTVSQQELLGKKYGRAFTTVAFRAEAAKYYGRKVASKMTIKDATEAELVNFAESMFKDKRTVLKTMTTPWGSGINPVRWVFGRGQELGFNTYKRIYEPIVKVFGQANEYTIARVSTCRAIFEQRGLGTVTFKKGHHYYKRAPGITKSVETEALRVAQEADNIIGQAHKINTPEAYAEAKKAISGLIDAKSPDAPAVRAVVDALQDYFNLLYGEDAIMTISREFAKLKLSPTGRVGVEKLLARAAPKIQSLFTTGGSHSYIAKHKGIQAILREVREAVPKSVGGRNRWVATTGKKLEGQLTTLEKNLTLSSKEGGQFIEYLESYMPRVSAIERGVEREVFNALSTKYTPFYTKAREMAQSVRPITELEQLIVARTRAQAKRIYLYDELGQVAKFASKLPENWRAYTEHYIARALNLPSKADENVAKWIGGTIGKFQKDPWNAARVMTLAKNVNDLSYMGFLGLKPFSAARNLFQPFLLVPADLGGLKDYSHLVRGMNKAVRVETRDYLRSIGIITEFAPETARTARLFGASGKKWLGIPKPDIEATRDFTLWMFKNSDKFNRYLTGASAMSKWERSLSFVGGKVTKANLQQFISKSGIKGRHSWVRSDITQLLEKGHIGDAKAAFIRDVVADTQYLYGKLDSPIISQSWGSVGRTIAIFQSWWMNYGHLLAKWLHTGQPPTHLLGAKGAKAERAIVWAMSAAAGYITMQKMWGSRMALRSTFVGPFPDLSQGFQLPPAWQPVGVAFGTVGAAARSIQETSWKPLGKQGLAFINSTTNFLPGALQLKMTAKATMKEGFPGFAKSIMRFRGRGSLFED